MVDARAKRFAVFCWIYAGLLGFSAIGGIFSLIFLLRGVGDSIGGPVSFDLFMNELKQPWGSYHYMFFAFVAYILIAATFTASSIISNVLLGKRLRSSILPSKRSIVLTSIVSAVSSIFAGLLFLPFGLALCIYGIWFASVVGSDTKLNLYDIK